MNRDAVLATIIGFAIGLTITGIFLIGPNLKSYLPSFTVPKLTKATNVDQPNGSTPSPAEQINGITIDSPLTEAVVDTDSLLVSGTAQPKSTLIVQGEVDDVILIVADDGKYAGKVSLREGKNDITVTGYSPEKKQTSMSVTVFYTTEEF